MREEEVFRGIAARVAARDYSDYVYVRPGYLDANGAWVREPAPEDMRWMEERGSQEHLAALAADAVDPLPPLEPASVQAVDEAEQALGHPLPPLLRRIYLEVANGGFGPVMGVAGGSTDDLGLTAVDRLDSREPSGLLPIAYWGCAVYSYVDCAGRGAMMWGFDPNSGLAEHSFHAEGISLVDWLDRWLNGRLEQPCLAPDPA
ncbi:SMI1/KNR4 family protein [Micromonospora echinospora]|uniref:SMI1/KNR4 family protein n=1 Tax=Micromonospora echinospora TaxID=1877 RepID=UPI0036710908